VVVLLVRCIHQNEIDVNDKLSEQTAAANERHCHRLHCSSVDWPAGRVHEEYLRRKVDLGAMARIRTSTE